MSKATELLGGSTNANVDLVGPLILSITSPAYCT